MNKELWHIVCLKNSNANEREVVFISKDQFRSQWACLHLTKKYPSDSFYMVHVNPKEISDKDRVALRKQFNI